MTSNPLESALGQAIRYLKRKLLAGEFGFSCIGSDGTPRFPDGKGHVFGGFFLAEALAGDLAELERTILLVRALSEERDGLWGYSPPAPHVGPEHAPFVVDADDTAYVLRMLRRLGVNRSPKSLLSFHRSGGLFVTFDVPGEPRIVAEPRAEDNLLAHPEVNANVFLALRGTNFESSVDYDLARAAQASDGHWPSYFYPSPLFATFLFLDLVHGRPALASVERRGLDFILESQNQDGSWSTPSDLVETALALNALGVCGECGEAFQRGILHLLEGIEGDGSWRSDRSIWEFRASAADTWRSFDTNRVFCTALCTMALKPSVASGADP